MSDPEQPFTPSGPVGRSVRPLVEIDGAAVAPSVGGRSTDTSSRGRVTMHRSLSIGATLLLAACVAPTTRMATIAPDVIAAEQLKQQQLVIQSELAEQRRVTELAYPMLRAAAPLCGQWVATRHGVSVSNLHAWKREYHDAARALGFSDTLSVVGVAAGSAAARAGIRVGDRLTEVAGQPAPMGRTAVQGYLNLVIPRATRGAPGPLAATPMAFTVRRAVESAGAPQELSLAVVPDTVCAYGAVAVKNDALNAWADGSQVAVTTAMMRFAATDDELAFILAHEIAHNAQRHIDAKNTNAGIGALFGLVVDVALATQGINTYGDFTNSGAEIGASAYSQDFEREADYVGMYVLARSNRPFDQAANFWRRMAQESPGSITYATTHPTSAERFVRLEEIATEIRGKIAAGEALIPIPKAPKRGGDGG